VDACTAAKRSHKEGDIVSQYWRDRRIFNITTYTYAAIGIEKALQEG
jgi:hypothetical protein